VPSIVDPRAPARNRPIASTARARPPARVPRVADARDRRRALDGARAVRPRAPVSRARVAVCRIVSAFAADNRAFPRFSSWLSSWV